MSDVRDDSVPGLVSVVIATYNRAALLPTAIKSVLNQTYAPIELIIVDDGSTDDTRKVVERYGERAKHVFQSGPLGQSAALNRGIQLARGEFVAFLDSDDIWLPDKLQRQVPLFHASPSVGMVGGGCAYIDADGEPIGSVVIAPEHIGYEDFAVFTAMPGSGSNAVVRRSIFAEVGVFDETLWRALDRDLWIRISQRYEVKCVPEPTVLIRIHSEPRPRSGWRDILNYRRRVNERILDRRLRRKADAWLWYNLFDRHIHDHGRSPLAFYFFTRSFLSYPYRIGPRNARIRPSLAKILPRQAVGLLRRMTHAPLVGRWISHTD